MSTQRIHNKAHAINKLELLLRDICASNEPGSFVHQLASSSMRWNSVQGMMSKELRERLEEIAFRSELGGFSACNLKAHYLLDEDFIDGGSAIIVFSLLGSTWTLTVRLKNQNQLISAEKWLKDESM
jgi:hypothetical protein